MTKKQLDMWLDSLKKAWETNSPDLAIDLVADKFTWYELPFQKPITMKQELINEWQSILDHKDVSMSYEIICMDVNIGIVRWQAKFSRISSNENVEMEGIYQVSLDDDGKCTEFHQWFNAK